MQMLDLRYELSIPNFSGQSTQSMRAINAFDQASSSIFGMSFNGVPLRNPEQQQDFQSRLALAAPNIDGVDSWGFNVYDRPAGVCLVLEFTIYGLVCKKTFYCTAKTVNEQ